jgi:predicted RNA-binding protein
MKTLEEMPAGAEVKFSTVMKQSEIDPCGVIDRDNEEDIYNLIGDIKEIDLNGNVVYLQS